MLTSFLEGESNMKPFVILVLLIFTLFANPAQSEPYLTEGQKLLNAELERRKAVEVAKKKASQQSTKTNTVRLHSRVVKIDPRSSYRSTARLSGSSKVSSVSNIAYMSFVTSNPKPQTQSLQSIFNNADWGTPTYSNRSVGQSRQVTTAKSNRPVWQSRKVTTTNSRRIVRQSRQVNTTAKSSRPFRKSRKVATTAKKINWSGFFKGLGQVAEAFNSGMNQTNPQFTPYIPQPTNFTPQRTNQIIRTMSVGNHKINVGGNQEIHTWDIGNQTFGTSGGKKVKMYNYGNFSHGTIGGQKVRCHMAGNIKFCK
jgi:hypothetical protein